MNKNIRRTLTVFSLSLLASAGMTFCIYASVPSDLHNNWNTGPETYTYTGGRLDKTGITPEDMHNENQPKIPGLLNHTNSENQNPENQDPENQNPENQNPENQDPENVTEDVCPHENVRTEYENEISPTCAANGQYDYVIYCDDCKSETHRETIVQDACLEYCQITVVPASASTCDAAGNIEYYVCSICERWYLPDFTVITDPGSVVRPLAEHVWGDWELTQAATCTVDGTETRKCTKYDSHTETRTVAAGHIWETRTETHPATCSESGEILEVVYCKNCNDIQSSKTTQVLPVLNHQWSSWTVKTKPTCINAGEEYRTCGHDPDHKETKQLQPLGHSTNKNTYEKEDGTVVTAEVCSTCKTTITYSETPPPPSKETSGFYGSVLPSFGRRMFSRPENAAMSVFQGDNAAMSVSQGETAAMSVSPNRGSNTLIRAENSENPFVFSHFYNPSGDDMIYVHMDRINKGEPASYKISDTSLIRICRFDNSDHHLRNAVMIEFIQLEDGTQESAREISVEFSPCTPFGSMIFEMLLYSGGTDPFWPIGIVTAPEGENITIKFSSSAKVILCPMAEEHLTGKPLTATRNLNALKLTAGFPKPKKSEIINNTLPVKEISVYSDTSGRLTGTLTLKGPAGSLTVPAQLSMPSPDRQDPPGHLTGTARAGESAGQLTVHRMETAHGQVTGAFRPEASAEKMTAPEQGYWSYYVDREREYLEKREREYLRERERAIEIEIEKTKNEILRKNQPN